LESVLTKLDDQVQEGTIDDGEPNGNCPSMNHSDRMNQAVALDLEAHSYRSYQGFICLIQISTLECDAVIDAIALRSMLSQSDGPFIRMLRDPRLIKVMHGADSDVLWLQRDFGTAARVVNLFDTARAAQMLGEESLSLAHLITKYCMGETRTEPPFVSDRHRASTLLHEKRMFQLADWRVRPLPPHMLQYARWDTHYLLYLYRLFCEELALRDRGHSSPTSRLQDVWIESSRIALRRYVIRALPKDAHLKMARQYKWSLTGPALLLLHELIQWRDEVARRADESPAYIIPNRFLYALIRERPRSGVQLERLLRRARLTHDRCLLWSSPKDARRLLELLQSRTPSYGLHWRPKAPHAGSACSWRQRVPLARQRVHSSSSSLPQEKEQVHQVVPR
jgi:exosome complex exonuclease RRP6